MGGQVNFPHRIKSGSYLPIRTNYLMLHSNFIYLDRDSMHTSEKTIRIPDLGKHEERTTDHHEPSCPAKDERTMTLLCLIAPDPAAAPGIDVVTHA